MMQIKNTAQELVFPTPRTLYFKCLLFKLSWFPSVKAKVHLTSETKRHKKFSLNVIQTTYASLLSVVSFKNVDFPRPDDSVTPERDQGIFTSQKLTMSLFSHLKSGNHRNTKFRMLLDTCYLYILKEFWDSPGHSTFIQAFRTAVTNSSA